MYLVISVGLVDKVIPQVLELTYRIQQCMPQFITHRRFHSKRYLKPGRKQRWHKM